MKRFLINLFRSEYRTIFEEAFREACFDLLIEEINRKYHIV